MADCQDISRSTDEAVCQNREEQHWALQDDLAGDSRAERVDNTKEKGKNDTPYDGSRERKGLFGGVGNAATHEEENFQNQQDATEPVAIIGFSFRFPQDATSSQGFWKMLYEGRSAMTEIPKDRFNIKAFYHPDSSRISSINFKGGHFVQNLAAFDAPFFSVTPAEAASMDPQQRGLLEITYRALENAGITLQAASGSKTSVHVGCFTREYDHVAYRDPELQPKYQASGSGFALLANRLSWYYNLTGPSMVIDTACSSSLNALHLGCESLRRGESEMGVVAGCNLIINPDTSTPLTNLNFLSPSSRCFSFDHRANGYARGEGIGVAIIKRLSDALRDGDTIRAVVRATGANQDGRTPGITQPSQGAQEDLIRATYKAGGLDFCTTRYFEAHGTGTAIGDPIEAGAIGKTFGLERSSDDPLFVGAVKSNIGHLEGASGIAGVLKTILVLENGIIPPNIGFEHPNPRILVDDWNIKFPIEPTLWPSGGLRRASVNSFGFGGANCHIVLDDAYNYLRLRALSGRHNTVVSPRLKTGSDLASTGGKEYGHESPPGNLPWPTTDNVALEGFMDSAQVDPVEVSALESHEASFNSHPQLLVWSASDETGLRRLATAYSQHDFGTHHLNDSAYFGALAYTLASRRGQFPWKSFSTAESISDMQKRLDRSMSKPIRSSETPRLGFIFSGQGATWHGMGRELLAYPVFRTSLRASEEYFQSLGSTISILDKLQSDIGYTRLDSAIVSQSLSTATQIALVDLLRSWKIYPRIIIGHSSGEIAAAYCIGALSKESALKVAYYRGVLADNLSSRSEGRGAMLAVALSQAEVEPYLKRFGSDTKHRDISVGCINSPKNITLTGGAQSVEAFEAIMKKENIFARKLNVNVAYHSKSMQDIAAEYAGLIKDIVPNTGRNNDSDFATMISTVSVEEVSCMQLKQPEYWVENLVSPVRFSEALVEACSASSEQLSSQSWTGPDLNARQVKVLIEIGPHSAMRSPVRDVLKMLGKGKDIRYFSVLDRGKSAIETVMDMAGELYCHGYQLEINKINLFGAETSDLNMLVDLPEYPFDHSREYWQESRLSSNFRFREHARHELLGTTVPDWNGLEGKWRNFIRVSESPWIKDHKVNDSQLYPAAGMLVMAIEAARQLADKTRELRGYRIREVNFHKAMVVPSDEAGLETNFFLHRHKATKSQQNEWSDFRLCSYVNGEWVDNCSGIVGLEYDEANDEVDNGREASEDLALRKKSFRSLVDRCKRFVKPEQLYSVLRLSGYDFGPTFQVLREISHNDKNEATAVLDPLSWRHKLPKLDVQNHVIHPTCLDGVLQASSVILTRGGRRRIPMTYPTRIEDLWISASFGSNPEFPMLRISGESAIQRLREVETSIVAMDTLEEKPQIVVSGFQATALANLYSVSATNSEQRRLCFNIDWKPDLDLMDNDQITQYCKTATNFDSQDDAMIQRNKDLELTCVLFMARTLAKVTPQELTRFEPHVQKYYQWMQRELTRLDIKEPMHSHLGWTHIIDDQGFTESLFDRMEQLDPVGKLIVTVGRQHVGILRDQVNVMELLFSTDLVTDFYRYIAEKDPNYRKFAVYLDALAHKNPGLRILEIGAGTGGTTAPALEALTQQGESKNSSARFFRYTFTDISSGFFEKAKARFAKHNDRMDFKTLDIETDPLQQGFEAESYDLIIAANVLHATSDLGVTLQNTRKLLKPHGKMILFEVCNLSLLRVPFPFGMLSGWWLSSEKDRQESPLMKEDNWHKTLSANGFSGADVILRDYEDHLNHTVSMIISSASENNVVEVAPRKLVIVASMQSSTQSQVAKRLNTHFASSMAAIECAIVGPQDVVRTTFKQCYCLFLPELDEPYLLDLDSNKFTGLQNIVASANGILWVTQAGIAAMKPGFALIEGLSRTVRSENRNLRFVTLAIEDPQEISRTVSAIVKATLGIFKMEQGIIESEYLENNRLLQISRVVEDHDMNEEIFTTTGSPKSQLLPFGHQPDRPLKLEIAVPGILDTLHFIDDPVLKQELSADDVDIRVCACGVNFSDVLIALGQVAGEHLGSECSGIVERVGHNVIDVRPGSRVCCFANGGYRSYVRVKAELLVEIPDDLSLATAAGIPAVYCTAYHALFNVARTTKGESILIHSAAGGVGQAAIQLAKIIGAEIFATVGTQDKKSLIMELYDIPEDHIFSSRNQSFSQGIRRMTRNRGVDVILNSLAGRGLRNSWDCIATFGRFVEIGKSDIYSHASLPMWPFSKCATFASGDLTMMGQEKPYLLGSMLRAVIDLLKEGRITSPHPQHIYRGGGLLKAFRYLQSGRNTGKTIVELHEDDLVPVTPDLPSRYSFDANATYVITGGSGGLGRSIARWMVGRGARNLILLSRSGMKSEAAIALMAELLAQKVSAVALRCDVSNAEALSAAMKDCESMPPIKGCIQGSLALKDAAFENFSLEDFKLALAPKVQGSYNLHKQLPKGMDFFILLSSIAGVTGNRGQSNYSCGNTYQDALARYRNSIGEKATAIDLSVVGSVGYIAERLGTRAAVQVSPEYMTIQETEFHAVLDHYCNPALGILSPLKSQLVMGIHTPSELASKGYDEPIWTQTSLFRHLAYMEQNDVTSSDLSKTASGEAMDVKTLLRKATTRGAMEEVVCQALVQRLSKSLAIPSEDVEVNKPMHRFGIDSLVAVEIRHWFRQEMKAEVTVIDILESGSVRALSWLVTDRSHYLSDKGRGYS